MNLSQRVAAFAQLGKYITNLDEDGISSLCSGAVQENPWFVDDNVKAALGGLEIYLEESGLKQWTSRYELDPVKPREIGLVAAGNIPLVSFHDLLCVLIGGHHVQLKLSSQDGYLMKQIIGELSRIEPEFKKSIRFVERIKEPEGVIATGSDNTSRYFEYYFRNIPHIIRKNRTACCVLDGNESETELKALGNDIFLHFGLGCRNISKIYVPLGYDFGQLFTCLESFSWVRNHHKYANNYDYNKAIYLINREPHLDNGFLLVKSDSGLVSPIAVLFYQEYSDFDEIKEALNHNQDKIQCVVSNSQEVPNAVPFGRAQFPLLWDYADGVDVMRFLEGLR